MKKNKIKNLSASALFICMAITVIQSQNINGQTSSFSSNMDGMAKMNNMQPYYPQLENDFKWPQGKKMALSLTFDDARLTQVDKGIPLLDKYNVKGTFYVSPYAMLERVEEWKNAIKNGHDIGNHTLSHPCTGNFAFSKNNAVENHTIQSMKEEIDSANMIIKEVLGIVPVSFAYPCGNTYIGRGQNAKSYVPLIASQFETGRGWYNEGPNDPSFCDLAQLTGIELDGKTFDEIVRQIKSAQRNGQWLVLVGHEMNDNGSQTSLLQTIEAICKYASDPDNGIWIDNIHNIASYIKEQRAEKSFSELPIYKNPLYSVDQRVGLERGAMELSERLLREVFLPPWVAGIKKAGALGVMATYPSIDGLPVHASEQMLTIILREELYFKGVVLGEGGGIGTIVYEGATPVLEGKIDLSLIDRAVKRILSLKFKLGLFENPFVDEDFAESVSNTKEHNEMARQVAREGIVLLKNEKNTLPLNKNIKSIAVIGPNA